MAIKGRLKCLKKEDYKSRKVGNRSANKIDRPGGLQKGRKKHVGSMGGEVERTNQRRMDCSFRSRDMDDYCIMFDLNN